LKINYIGPFVDGKALKETLKSLRKVFPYRSCYKIPKRPCLWYHLERCPGPCLLKFSKTSSQGSSGILEKMEEKIKRVSQRNTKNLMKILKEGENPVLKELKREMKLASKNQDFEEAGKIRDQIGALERILDHAKVFEPVLQIKPWHKMYDYAEEELRKLLKTKNKISRIEAYDVSNIQGKEATGSMVTFINGLPDKNFYRRFKIKVAGKPNDIAMLKECLNRRLNHPEWGLPDLILIDGGIAQLNAAVKCKMQNAKCKMIKMMALAKKRSVAKPPTKFRFGAGENKLYLEGQKNPVLLKNLPREIFNLVLQLRDEAHRFAISYHKKLREKSLLQK